MIERWPYAGYELCSDDVRCGLLRVLCACAGGISQPRVSQCSDNPAAWHGATAGATAHTLDSSSRKYRSVETVACWVEVFVSVATVFCMCHLEFRYMSYLCG